MLNRGCFRTSKPIKEGEFKKISNRAWHVPSMCSVPVLHVRAAVQAALSMLRGPAACPRGISMIQVHAACLCSASILHILAASPCCMSKVQFKAVCTYMQAKSMPLLRAAFPFFTSVQRAHKYVLHVHAAFPCCMSLLSIVLTSFCEQ